jgi:hypothetical protein
VNWPVSVSGPVETSPALGDFDGDGNDEVVAAVKNPSGGTDIYVWNGSGYPLTNWPKHITEEIEDSPVLADVDGNGTLDILLGTTIGNVYAWNYSTGNALLGWPPTNKPDCSVRGIVVGNAQGDWHNEVYAAATTVSSPEHATIYGWDFQGTKLTGWPHNSPTHVFGSLALGDYDKDGNLEVVGVQDTLGGLKLKSWTGAGARKLTTSLGVGMSCASPALGDVRNSGYLDVFFADSWGGNLRAWNYQWILQSQFSKNIGSIWASPSLGRFLGQNKENVFVGHCAAVYGYDSTGLDLSGWPQQEVGSVTSTPCLTDLDGDGQTEMISATEDGWVYVWALGTLYDREHQDWPMYMHDRWHTGRYSQIVSGNLPGNTIWEGDIEVKGNVTVLAGQTLTIKPGTVVKFRGAYRLIVNANATLNAIGTLLDSIYFTSSKPNPAPNDWTGIDVSGTANLQFCAVRYGNNNLTGQTNSILNVSSSRFTNAAAAGIVLRRGPHNVSYCDISNNNLFGINVWGAWANGVNATIQNNTLAQNQKYGIYAHFNINSGTVSVNSNTINFMWMPPINPSLSGIKCDTVTNVVKLYANNISGYGQDGINMLRSSPKCTCNVISSINNNGLYFYNGSSVVTHNSVDAVNIGAYVTGPATSTTVPNLGNGVAGSDGLNGIVGNTWRGYNTLGTQVKAQNNWWGGYPPDPAWFSGSWDYTRPLPSPPASCGGGGGGPQMGELLEQQLPRVFALAQSRPNPSTGELVIHYQLPKACDVSIKIYNVSGQLVKNMVKGPQKAGYYAASWKGRDETGHAVRSGVYFYKMEAGEFRAIRKLVIVR